MKKNVLLVLLVMVFSLPIGAISVVSEQIELAMTSIKFSVNPPSQKTIDENSELVLLAEPRFCGEEIYKQWYFEEEPIPNANDNELIIPQINTANAGEYWLVIWGDGIESFSSSCLVIVYSDLRVISHPWPLTKLEEETAELVVAVEGGTPPYSYNWHKDGSSILISSEPRLILENLTLADGGYYYCLILDNNSNQVSSMTAKLTVLSVETNPPTFFIDREVNQNFYLTSLNPYGADLASILSDPYSLPEGCNFSNITAIGIFHQIGFNPWTVIEIKTINGVPSNSESDQVAFFGQGIDWSGNPTSFAITNDSVFNVQFFFKTSMTGDNWLWINSDYVELVVNNEWAQMSTDLFVVDFR